MPCSQLSRGAPPPRGAAERLGFGKRLPATRGRINIAEQYDSTPMCSGAAPDLQVAGGLHLDALDSAMVNRQARRIAGRLYGVASSKITLKRL